MTIHIQSFFAENDIRILAHCMHIENSDNNSKHLPEQLIPLSAQKSSECE
jgi:hypothetical protein